jgi:hypothetical protein
MSATEQGVAGPRIEFVRFTEGIVAGSRAAFTDPAADRLRPPSDTTTWQVVTALRDSATHQVHHFLKAGAGHFLEDAQRGGHDRGKK